MSASAFTRYSRAETIPDATAAPGSEERLFRRLLIGGVASWILGVTMTTGNPCVGLAAGVPDEPPGRKASTLQSPNDVSGLDGDAELKLMADLAAAFDAYADHFDPGELDRELAAAFRRYRLDLDRVDPKIAGEQLGRRASTRALASELDRWCHIRRTRLHDSSWRRLTDVARAADPDPWRNALRDQYDRAPADALPALQTLAANARALETQPAASLIVLALLIDDAGDQSGAASVLCVASRRFASNFWVWFELGRIYGSRAENPNAPQAAQSFARAVALRPRSVAAHTNLGSALANEGKMDEATVVFLEADRLKKDSNVQLTDTKQLDQALTVVETRQGHEPAHSFDQSESVLTTPEKEALAEVFSPVTKSAPICASDCRGALQPRNQVRSRKRIQQGDLRLRQIDQTRPEVRQRLPRPRRNLAHEERIRSCDYRLRRSSAAGPSEQRIPRSRFCVAWQKESRGGDRRFQ